MTVESELMEHKRGSARLKTEIDKRDKTIENLKATIAGLEKKKESLVIEVAEEERKGGVLEDEKNRLQTEMLEIQKQVKEAESSYKMAADERDSLNEELQKYFKDLSDVQTDLNIAKDQKATLEQQVLGVLQIVNVQSVVGLFLEFL